MGLFNPFTGLIKNKPADKQTPAYYKIREFDAGALDRLKASWTTNPQRIDELLEKSRSVMVARSREAAQNNGYAKRFLGLLKTNICGPDGFRLQAQTLTNKGKSDKLLNDSIESSYKQFSKLGKFDVTGQLTRTEAEHLYITTLATDGEVIIRVIDGFNNDNRIAIQFIDTELLDVNLNKKLKNGNIIRMGVELDNWRRPIAYWFINSDSREEIPLRSNSHQRVPASEIIHDFLKYRINQTRGIPWMFAALTDMNDLYGYKEAAIINSRVSASKMMAVITPSGNEYPADAIDSFGNKIEEVEPGMIKEYPEGTSFHNFDPTYPHSQYDSFIKTTLRGIASGLEVSYNSLASDLEGVNFSSIRAGVLEDREVWKTLQRFVIEHFCERVYEQWLKRQLMIGNIKVKGQPLSIEREDKCLDILFVGRRWDWVDPLKDISANEKAHLMGVKSLSQIIRDQGRDPDDVWHEIQMEREKLSDLGLDTGASNETQQTTQTQQTEQTDTTDTTDSTDSQDAVDT